MPLGILTLVVLGLLFFVFRRSPMGGGSYHFTLLAQNDVGYRNLVKLITTAHLDGFHYRPRIDKEEGHRLRSTTSKRVDTSGVGVARVQGDADALRRVVRNLGENAARHASSRDGLAALRAET